MSWIDDIIAACEREYPDRDISTLPPMVRLARVAILLEAFQDDVLQRFGLIWADYGVLAALRRTGKPYRLSPGELTNQLHRSSGGMTKVIDRLEERGYVQRRADSGDRRGTLVGLTRSGLALQDKVFRAFLDATDALLEPVDPRSLRQVDRGLGPVLDAFELWWAQRGEEGK